MKKQRHYFTNKGPSSQSYGFSSGPVWTWELDYKESWMPKNWCFLTVVLEKTLESPLDCKEIQPVHPKGDESWVFIGRTDAEAETPTLWPTDAKSWLTGKDPDAGKDGGQEEKGMTEDEMAGWYHRLDGHEFGSWWWTGSPGMLQSMTSQRVRQDWVTELKWKWVSVIYQLYLSKIERKKKNPAFFTFQIALMALTKGWTFPCVTKFLSSLLATVQVLNKQSIIWQDEI